MKYSHGDIRYFKKLLSMEQHELHKEVLSVLTREGYKTYNIPGSYVYAPGDIPVLLCAHLDTVHPIKPTMDTIFLDQEKGVIWGPNGIGGDDRCGVYNILDILKKGYKPHVIFSWDEEIGGVGASKFADYVDAIFGKDILDTIGEINFAIQLDRKGFGEAVYYELNSPEFEEYISSFGFKTEIGSYTDICEYCPTFGFAGVNVSAGYLNEHTDREMIFLGEMFKTKTKIIQILENQMQEPTKFEYVDFGDSFYNGYYTGSAYTYWDESDYEPGDPYEDSYNKTVDTSFCQFCGQSKGVVPWTEDEDPVLNTLCDECKNYYKTCN